MNKKIFSRIHSRIIAAALLTVLLVTLLCGCSASPLQDHTGSQHSEPPAFHETEPEGHYYTIEQARDCLTQEGYRLGQEIDVLSEDGHFRCMFSLAEEEYNFCTISGCVEFTAAYSEGSWFTRAEPRASYDWNTEGSWFAETEHYDVYLDILSCDGSRLNAMLEARYDSTEGGEGSYGVHQQEVTLQLFDDPRDVGIYDVYLYCQLSGGYPIFTLHIDRDAMLIWQLYDSFKAELIPN